METVLVTLFLLFAQIQPIDSLISLYNSSIGFIETLLTTDIIGEMNPAIFNGMIEPLKVVGFALTILLWLYGLLKVEGTLAEMKRPETVFKHMLRLIIMIWLVQYAPEIVKAIWDIGIKLAITAKTGIFSLDSNLFSVPLGDVSSQSWDLVSVIGTSANLKLPLTIFIVLLCVACNIGARIVVLLCVYQIFTSILTRFFRLLLLYVISPIAAAGSASEETQRVSIQFAKNLIAVSSELALTTILLRLFRILCNYFIKDGNLDLISTFQRVIQNFISGVIDVSAFAANNGTTGGSSAAYFLGDLPLLLATTLLFMLLLFTLKSAIRGLNSIIDSLFGLHGV